jgi:SNF2 family DNA or RNA helicase
MSPRVVRTRREDIPNFPETTIQPVLFDFGPKFLKLERQYEKEIAEIRGDKDLDNAAVRYQFYRQKVEFLKVPHLVEHVKELNMEGFKVVVFFSFLRSIEEFRAYYEDPVTIISGVQKDDLAEFQAAGSGTEVALCQYAAGGAGINLQGPDPRVAILNPTPSALEYKQALGRIHRIGGGSTVQKLIFASNTIEEKVYHSVMEKAAGIDVLNDGDLSYYGEIHDPKLQAEMEL